MRGNFVCLLALILIIPACFYIFPKYGGAKATIIAFFGAVLFLPMEELQVPLILYNKMTATGVGVILAIKATDGETLEKFSLHPLDYPMLVWTFSVVLSSIVNGLGLKDGFQESFNTFTLWGVPYLAGRLYLSNPKTHLLLCQSLFLCGFLYMPLVSYELTMSPQAHSIVYGYMQHSFAQMVRGNGYRPMVFMQHGIMLGTFMCMASLVGIWCTVTGVFPKKKWGVPSWLLCLVLTFCAIVCKSSGAMGLMMMGAMILIASSRLKITLFIWLVLLIPPAYISTRSTGYWDGQNAVDLITEKFSEERASSLAFRFDNENILVEKALERPLLGWGGWGRSRVYDPDTGEDLSITDGFWVITLGSRGFMGLISVSLVLFLPMLLFTLNNHPKTWSQPEIAPSAVIAIIPLLLLIDCTLNAMINQMYIVFAGAITGMIAQKSSYQTRDNDLAQNDLAQEETAAVIPSPLVPCPTATASIRTTKPWAPKTRFALTSGYSGPRFQLTKNNKTLNNQEEKNHGHQKKEQRVPKNITAIK